MDWNPDVGRAILHPEAVRENLFLPPDSISFLLKYIFIYLAVWDLSCSTWDL